MVDFENLIWRDVCVCVWAFKLTAHNELYTDSQVHVEIVIVHALKYICYLCHMVCVPKTFDLFGVGV